MNASICAEYALGLKEDIKQTKESMAHVYNVTGLQKHLVSVYFVSVLEPFLMNRSILSVQC